MKLLPFILILCFLACAEKPLPASQKTSTPEIEPLIDFFSLANKSPGEIEKTYGKAVLIDKKFVQFENGEYRHYNKNGKRFLQVDYYKGKAVAFYLNIPENYQTQSAENTLKLCGLNLFVQDAYSEPTGLWWDNSPGATPFYSVSLSKFNNSGLYYTCEAHIKV